MKGDIRPLLYEMLQESCSALFSVYKYFKHSEKVVLEYLNLKSKNSGSESFLQEVSNYLSMKGSEYVEELEFRRRIDKIKNLTYELETLYHDYLKKFDVFMALLKTQDIRKIDRRTLDTYSLRIDELNTKVLKDITLFEDIEFNEYIIKKNNLRHTVSKLVELQFIVLNLVSESKYYVKDINFKKLKKLKYDEIQEGDILLLRKANSVLTSFRKLASVLLESNFIHSAIVYKKYKGDVYLFEGLAFDDKKTLIEKMERGPKLTYLVLRPKNRLDNKQIKKLKALMEENIGIKYSHIKTLGAFFQRHKEIFFKDTLFQKNRRENPFKELPGMFCSEIVVKIYNKIGVRIGFNEDDSIISPIDILNSPELDYIGYYK